MKITSKLFLPLILLIFTLLSLPTHSEKQQAKTNNPFIFGQESFEELVSSDHGKLKVLKHLSELSPILYGISNYRLGCYEADPLTFLMPIHFNGDAVFYVAQGEGVIALLRDDRRESHVLKEGDIIRVWAGSMLYLINKSKSQKLKIVALLHSIVNTGNIQVYNSVGSEDAKSYYQGFSMELLEAALKTRKERLHQLFGSKTREIISTAPEAKLEAIAQRASKSQTGPRPFNLFNKRPVFQNNRGQLFLVNNRDYDQLKDVYTDISFTNISSGSMMAPFYNTRAFKFSVVVKGKGYVEIINPEEEEEEEVQQRESKVSYTRVSSQLSEGTVYISPPGHPIAIVASKDQGLQIVSFEVRPENNKIFMIAGKNNVLGELEDEAKELAFGVSAKVVDEVLRGQDEEVFMAAKWVREEGGKRERPLMESIVQVVEGF